MNREIKFRGKGIEEYDKDKWYYGSYFIYNKINYFYIDDGSRIEEINEKLKNNIKHKIIFEVQGDLNMKNHIKLADVNPDTVGQYTGLDDKNGKEIWENDIVEITREGIYEKGIIIFKNGCFFIKSKETLLALYNCELNNYKVKVIGDITDNSELLGGE